MNKSKVREDSDEKAEHRCGSIEKNTKNRRLAMGTKGRKNVKKPKQNKEKKK